MTTPTVPENPEQTLRLAQLEQVKLANEKLKHELAELKKGKPWYYFLLQFVPIVSALVAMAGFTWGVIQYQDQQNKNREIQAKQLQHEAEQAEQALMKPWIENQRGIYLQTLAVVSLITHTEDSKLRQQASEEFWQLYDGKMILVETTEVSAKMVDFGNCLNGVNKCTNTDYSNRSRNLASAMAESMATTAKMTYKEFTANQFKYK